MLFNSHKKRKVSLETQAVLLLFLLELEVSWVAVPRKYIKTAKMNACKKDSFSGDPFSCSYHYGTNTSEAIEKVATDEKDYHKCCLCHTCVLHHINDNKKSFLIGHIQRCLKKL